jgi:hypothetical protein
VRLKYLTTGLAAATLVGAAALGVISIAAGPAPSTTAVTLAVFGAPLPQQPAADLPTSDQLMAVLNGLADPSVPFRSKSNLIEGGVGIVEGHAADRLLANASQQGYLPLSFQVSNIQPAGAGAASASVTASGPNLAPKTANVVFVDEGGWKISRTSATSLLQTALPA